MKTLLKNQKSKFILAALGTSLCTSTAFSQELKPSYTEIKSKIILGERAAIVNKRDNLAKTTADRELLYISNILDETRESTRLRRIR
jgi:hypothetical protein